MKESREGKDIEVPEPPLEYVILKYAQKMHISYMDAAATPAHIVFRNYDMWKVETEYGPSAAKVG